MPIRSKGRFGWKCAVQLGVFPEIARRLGDPLVLNKHRNAEHRLGRRPNAMQKAPIGCAPSADDARLFEQVGCGIEIPLFGQKTGETNFGAC